MDEHRARSLLDLINPAPPDRGLVTKRCRCGHGIDAHLLDRTSGWRPSGACRRGHYGIDGTYTGGGCPCEHYVRAPS